MHPIQAHNSVLFNIIHRVVYSSPHSIFEHCHHLQRNPIPISNHLPPRILPPSKPWKQLIYFPFFWPCQFGTFNIGEIILYVVRGINFFLFLTMLGLFCCLGFWSSQGKNIEVVCHSLLQWTTFCQNSPPGPVCLGCPYTAWLIASLS